MYHIKNILPESNFIFFPYKAGCFAGNSDAIPLSYFPPNNLTDQRHALSCISVNGVTCGIFIKILGTSARI
jgi:hypothetical protein